MANKEYQVNNFRDTGYSVRIAVFEDNRNIRNDIVSILAAEARFEVVGVYSNVSNFVRDLLRARPDIVLIDIAVSGSRVIDAVARLKKEFPNIQILVQTSSEDDNEIYQSVHAGAAGYILKSDLKEKLVAAIKELNAGGSPMSPVIARRVLQLLKQKEPVRHRPAADYNLTLREKEVLTCLVNGRSYKMISSELNISYETVRSHMKNIYEKLHVSSLTEVVAKSINFNLV